MTRGALYHKDYYRIACVLVECPVCYARRGELCKSMGKNWASTGHYQRIRASGEIRKRDKAKYNKLRIQCQEQYLANKPRNELYMGEN